MTNSNKLAVAEALDSAQSGGSLLVCESAEKSLRCCLDRMFERGDLVRPAPSSYARSDYWQGLSPVQRHVHVVRALAAKHPGWVFCGVTAAAVLGYDPTWALLGKVHVAGDVGHRKYETGLVKPHELGEYEVLDVNGVLVTVPSRTVFDCIRTVPFADGLAIADCATRLNAWSDDCVASIVDDFAQRGRHHGIRRAREVALLVDGRAESGGESIARANMVRAGFEVPELQINIEDALDPQKTYRVDFGWLVAETGLIVGELDGRQKYLDNKMTGGDDLADVLLRERLRESRISATASRIVRFSYEQARNPAVLAQILDAFGVPRMGKGARRRDAEPGLTRTGFRRLEHTRYLTIGSFDIFAERLAPATPIKLSLGA